MSIALGMMGGGGVMGGKKLNTGGLREEKRLRFAGESAQRSSQQRDGSAARAVKLLQKSAEIEGTTVCSLVKLM